jgi:hypothetical protein
MGCDHCSECRTYVSGVGWEPALTKGSRQALALWWARRFSPLPTHFVQKFEGWASGRLNFGYLAALKTYSQNRGVILFFDLVHQDRPI